jgi:phage baseplate assembly protein V
MDDRTFGRMAAPLARRLQNLVVRGTVALANAASKMQGLQVTLLKDDVPLTLEHFEPFGFTSKPKPGAEVVTLFLDGDRSHGIVIVCADRRYRLMGLEDGEVAIHDDKAQAVVLKADGIHVYSEHTQVHGDMTIDGALVVTNGITTPNGGVEITGNIAVTGDAVIGGKSFLGHRHGGGPIPD